MISRRQIIAKQNARLRAPAGDENRRPPTKPGHLMSSSSYKKQQQQEFLGANQQQDREDQDVNANEDQDEDNYHHHLLDDALSFQTYNTNNNNNKNDNEDEVSVQRPVTGGHQKSSQPVDGPAAGCRHPRNGRPAEKSNNNNNNSGRPKQRANKKRTRLIVDEFGDQIRRVCIHDDDDDEPEVEFGAEADLWAAVEANNNDGDDGGESINNNNNNSYMADNYADNYNYDDQQQQQLQIQQIQQIHQDQEDYRNFDPYSVYADEDEEEDVWYSEERLLEDHVNEIIDKWQSIDDEIWAKIICMERNRRIAKAYARKHLLTINGSDDDYLDGTTLGLNSFENQHRDSKTNNIKRYIGQGVQVRISQCGDIFVKRLSGANVFVHQLRPGGQHHQPLATTNIGSRINGSHCSSSDPYAMESNESSSDLYGLTTTTTTIGSSNQVGGPQRVHSGSNNSNNNNELIWSSDDAINTATGGSNRLLEANQMFRVFDMRSFKSILEREARRPFPNRIGLRNLCISVVSFVLDDKKLLNLPSWVMIINIVALELLQKEIGLVDPHSLVYHSPIKQMSTPATTTTVNTRHSSDYNYHHPIDGDYSAEFVAEPSRDGLMAKARKGAQLSASKRAFANAAALGAYNGDYYYKQSGPQTRATASIYNSGNNINRGDSCAKTASKEAAAAGANSDGELHHHRHIQNQQVGRQSRFQDDLLDSNLPIPRNQKSGSASSGFNSHCSSQNDSSATSSRSNIASSGQAAPAAAAVISCSTTGQLGDRRPPTINGPSKSLSDLQQAARSPPPLAAATKAARGKRPPKLPHGIAERPTPKKSCEPKKSQVSKPIPIPAPPTSSGGPASGKANLILVSPTGLSPPMSKRMVASRQPNAASEEAKKKMEDYNNPSREPTRGGKLILQTKQKSRLPAGIPPHAQLAPPETRKHILRYLMSASNVLEKPPAPPTRIQRPLPVLPTQLDGRQPIGQQLGNPHASEDSLYYYGLQARVPTRRLHPDPTLPVYPISKSAINSVLNDFKFKQSYQKRDQQFALLNSRQMLTKRLPGSESSLHQDNFFKSSKSTNGSNVMTSPLNRSDPNARYGDNMGFLDYQNPSNKKFTSLDNLHQQHGPSSKPSFLNHVGGFLRRTKAKKASTNGV